jgi:autotransporter-associated beta strand protein
MSRIYADAKRTLLAVVCASPLTALAGNVWTGLGSNNNWTTGANWNGDNQPPANNGSIDVVMGGTMRLLPIVNVPYDIRGLIFNFDAGPFALTGQELTLRAGGILQGDAGIQTIHNVIDIEASQTWDAFSGPLTSDGTINLGGLTPHTLNISGPFATTINGRIEGLGTLVKFGMGSLTLGGSTGNNYIGTTIVNSGTLLLNKSTGSAIRTDLTIGDGSGLDVVKLLHGNQIAETDGLEYNDVIINSSGLLDLNGFDSRVGNLILTGSTVQTGGAEISIKGEITTLASSVPARIVGNHNFAGFVTVADGTATDDLTMDGSADPPFGSGVITKTGPGQLVLRGTFATTALYVTVNSGTIVLDKSNRTNYVTVGDGAGGLGADVVNCLQNDQFYRLVLRESGRLNLGGTSQTIVQAFLQGGEIDTGSGTLDFGAFLGTISVQTSSATSRIIGNGMVVMGTPGAIDVVDSPPVVDFEVAVPINTFTKTGAGRMLLSGASANTMTSPVALSAGALVLGKSVADGAIRQGINVAAGTTLSLAANEQIAAAGTVTMNASAFELNGFTETVDAIHLASASVNFGGGKLATRLMQVGGTSSLDIGIGTLLVSEQLTAIPAADLPITGNLDLGGGTCTVYVGTEGAVTNLDISAVIRNGHLAKTGPSQLVFSGSASNTYAGTTTIKEGSLLLSRTAGANAAILGPLIVGDATHATVARTTASEQIANGSPLTVNSLSSFDISGQTESIASVTMSGGSIITGTGTLIVGGNISHSGNATSTIGGNLDLGGVTRTLNVGMGTAPIALDVPAAIHNGGLLVQGGGALRLSNSNSFAGGMTMAAGSLLLGSDSAAGTATLTVSNASLAADGAPRALNNPLHFAGPTAIEGALDVTLNGSLVNDVGNGITKRGPATLTVAGPQSHGLASTFDALDGTVTFASDCGQGGANLTLRVIAAPARVNFLHSQHLASLVASAGRSTLATGGSRTLVTNGLFIDTTDAFVDVMEHAAVVDYTGLTQYGTVAAYIATARNGGAWDGPGGLTSSAAASHPTHSTTLGVMEGSDYRAIYGQSATFKGESVDDTSVLVRYTWYGDTDFNGTVNFDDYVRIDNGFNNHLAGWLNGDFDLNGVVNFDDYVLIDLAFNTQSGTLRRALAFLDGTDRSSKRMSEPALGRVEQHFAEFGGDYARHFLSAVPEPAVGACALVLAGRRRRGRRGR